MIVRKILTKDFYPTLVEWSKAHKFPSKDVVLNIEYLPGYVWVCIKDMREEIPMSTDYVMISTPIYSVFVYPSENIACVARGGLFWFSIFQMNPRGVIAVSSKTSRTTPAKASSAETPSSSKAGTAGAAG